jgi:preprotein translocase subunit SecA
MAGMLGRLGLKDGEAIVHPWINKALEKAQKKVEARNFDMRKNVLKYDDVMNDQRREVYAQRREFMKSDDVSETVDQMRAEVINALVTRRIPERAFAEQWESNELAEDCRRILMLDLPIAEWAREDGIGQAEVLERIERASDAAMAAKAANFGPEIMRFVEKSLLLQMLDAVWKEHLLALDHLRQGIGLRAYGQRDPLNEYKSEAFALFNAMLDDLKERVTTMLSRVQLTPEVPPESLFQPTERVMVESHPAPEMAEMAMAGGATQFATAAAAVDEIDPNDPQTWANAPRNAPCPCGSGKKFKHCHGRVA